MATPHPAPPSSHYQPRNSFALALVACLHLGLTTGPADTIPQAPLPTIRLQIGTNAIQVEVADESDERITGLMGRTHLAEGTGMLRSAFGWVVPSSRFRSPTSMPPE